MRDNGYLSVDAERTEKGRFGNAVYLLHDVPVTSDGFSVPGCAEPATPQLISTNKQSTNKQSTNTTHTRASTKNQKIDYSVLPCTPEQSGRNKTAEEARQGSGYPTGY